MRWVWFNGEIVPESEARLSIYDSALMFGDMVFEMTRSFRKKQFMLREHLERLYRSARYFRIDIGMTIEEMEQACHDIQEKNEFEPDFKLDDEHRLMINVSRGILPMYSDTGRVGSNVIISDFPLRWTTAGMGKLFDVGINAVTPSQRAIPAHLLDPKVKCRSRAHLMMANIEVSGYEGDCWPVILNKHGHVTESTGANVFTVYDGIIYTPSYDCLEGISRAYVMENGCETAELDLYDLYQADEMFFTATPFCALPVVSINGQKIGDGKPGPIYNDILEIWSEDVGVDIKAQIQEWDKGAKPGPSAYKFK